MNRGPLYPPIERLPAPFKSSELQQLLDGEHGSIRELVRRMISRPDFAYYSGTDTEEYRDQVLRWTRTVAQMGLGKIFLGRSVGGEEDLPKFMAVFETLSFHDISLVIKVGVQFGLFAGSIQRLGTEYHHQKYLSDAASAKLLGCFAMTEIGHGSNVQSLETVARYEQAQGCFVISSPTLGSRKTYIGNAGRDGSIATVFAQLEIEGKGQGVHAFLVPIRDENGVPLPGVTIQDNGLKMGLNGVDNGQIWFDHVTVPREHLLNRYANVTEEGQYQSEIQSAGKRFFSMIGTLVSGRISLAASANSIAKSALTIAIRYAARRRQFGPPDAAQETLLLDYPTHQRRLFPFLANVFALDFALKHLVNENAREQTGDSRQLETLAAGLKAFTTWNTTATLQICREACGGEGYLSVNRLAALKADSDVYTTFEGDNTVLLQLVAKNLLTDLKEKMKPMRKTRLASFFVDQKLAILSKRNPFLAFNTLNLHLRDPGFHLMMLRLRESAQLVSCAEEFMKLTNGKKMDPYSAFTAMQRPLLDLAEAHVEREVLELFVQKMMTIQSESLKSPFRQLCCLFALSRIELHRAWYLENGALSGIKSRAVCRTVDDLCAELRPIAVHLVDSFGIPESCLAAPIAR
jgi:acyl-CoA oxidase